MPITLTPQQEASLDPENLFSKILQGEIPADVVFENTHALGFKDIQPQAPIHVLFIAKQQTPSHLETNDPEIYGQVLSAARSYALQEGLRDYRLVFNNGAEAGQTVFHMHLHLLAGRPFTWPPG